MKAVTGIFASFEQARRSAEELTAAGISDERINFLTPGASAAKNSSGRASGSYTLLPASIRTVITGAQAKADSLGRISGLPRRSLS